MKELFMTLNLARVDPVFFSNNVLESLRDRVHVDKFYNSPSTGMNLTVEGLEAMDSCIMYTCKHPKVKGVKWNTKLKNCISLSSLAKCDVVN
mmetsp:Transcript_16193/g.11692  ORF Transcript_16193/g.11692 Transcript_16193/m.11692 type:complete len:92 (+) Transcript_16193:124-399(+)